MICDDNNPPEESYEMDVTSGGEESSLNGGKINGKK